MSIAEKLVTVAENQQKVFEAGANSIPVSEVTATAEDVLSGKQFLDASGNIVSGSMVNRGGTGDALKQSSPTYTIPKGYHNGTGEVAVSSKEMIFTPTKESQIYQYKAGDASTYPFLSRVLVNPIPGNYQDVSAVTATAADVAEGKVIVTSSGRVTGTAVFDSGGSSGDIVGILLCDATPASSFLPTKCIAKGVVWIPQNTVYNSQGLTEIVIDMDNSLHSQGAQIDTRAFYYCPKVSKITFKSTPAYIANNAFYNVYSPNGLVVNVPWAEGEVTGAPWGLTMGNVTINYNYSGG